MNYVLRLIVLLGITLHDTFSPFRDCTVRASSFHPSNVAQMPSHTPLLIHFYTRSHNLF